MRIENPTYAMKEATKILDSMHTSNFDQKIAALIAIGFIEIPIAGIESDKPNACQRAYDMFKEMNSPFAIIIAVNKSPLLKEIVKNEFSFEYICNTNDIEGEKIFAWYPKNIEDAKRMVAETEATICT